MAPKRQVKVSGIGRGGDGVGLGVGGVEDVEWELVWGWEGGVEWGSVWWEGGERGEIGRWRRGKFGWNMRGEKGMGWR